MAQQYADWQYWVLQNVKLLSQAFGQNRIVLNGRNWQSILIFGYLLPDTWKQQKSRLLIVLPPKSQIFYKPPERFYMDWGLRLINGKRPPHYFENDSFNDKKNQKMARFSFHVKENNWNPRINCLDGTNLHQVIQGFYKGLISAAKEGLK